MKLRPGIPFDAETMAQLIAGIEREITSEPEGVGAEAYLASVSDQAQRGYLGIRRVLVHRGRARRCHAGVHRSAR